MIFQFKRDWLRHRVVILIGEKLFSRGSREAIYKVTVVSSVMRWVGMTYF